MHHVSYENWQTTHDGRNRMTKSIDHNEKETYKYLEILEADTIKQQEMKEKIQKEYLRRTRKLIKTKLNSRKLVKEMNTWAVPLVRYSGQFLKWA